MNITINNKNYECIDIKDWGDTVDFQLVNHLDIDPITITSLIYNNKDLMKTMCYAQYLVIKNGDKFLTLSH